MTISSADGGKMNNRWLLSILVLISLISSLHSPTGNYQQMVASPKSKMGEENFQQLVMWNEYLIPDWNILIKYPSDWQLQPDPRIEYGIRISSPNVNQEQSGLLSEGAYISVYLVRPYSINYLDLLEQWNIELINRELETIEGDDVK